MTFNFDGNVGTGVGNVAQALGAVCNGFATAIIPLLRNSLYDWCIICRNNGSQAKENFLNRMSHCM